MIFAAEENRTVLSVFCGTPKAEQKGHKIESICEANVGKVQPCRFSDGSPRKAPLVGAFFVVTENRTQSSIFCGTPKAEQKGHKIELICEANVGKVQPCRFSDGSPRRRKLHIARFRATTKSSLIPLLLLSAKSLARFFCSVASALTTKNFHYRLFAVIMLFSW